MTNDPTQLALWALNNRQAAQKQLDKLDAESSLYEYMRVMWPVLEPSRQLVKGWVLEVICEHLEAITKGQIRRLVIAVPPGSSKPIAESELILTRRGRLPLRDVVVGDDVMTHHGRFRRVSAVHVQGVLPVVRIETAFGRVVRAALDHPFLTPSGWKQAGLLDARDTLAAVSPTEPYGSFISDEEARFLGYLIGDGCVKYSGKTFTNLDEDILRDFEHCATFLGFGTKRSSKIGTKALKVSLNANHTSVLRDFLTRHGLNGQCSYTKRIPPAVMNGSLRVAENFLGAYWSCDGHLAIRHTTKTKTSHIAVLTTVSVGLADDTHHLMLRCGISVRKRTRISPIRTRKQGETYKHYVITATNQHEVSKIAILPGLCPRKRIDSRPREFQNHLHGDPVLSVTAGGSENCRCLTVEEDQSFTVNDLAVHNSLLSSVFWPTWEWGPKSLPTMRYIKAAYAEGLTIRDNRKAMMLIDSPLYQSMWADRFKMDPTQQAKTKFENLSTGWMLATSVGGTGTGERGDRFIIDDPHSVQKADSEARRIEALQWFTEVVPTRVNDPDKSAMLTIMQRVHEDDVVGHIIANSLNWDMLCIPMRYESDHPTKSRTALDFKDPRKIDGELMWPERFSEDYLSKDLEPNLRSWGGEYAVSSQLQQRPAPRGGGMFLRDKIQIVDPKTIPQLGTVARGWDLAATKDGQAAFTASVKMRKTSSGDIYIEDVRRERLTPNEVYKLIRSCAEQDGQTVVQDLPQDPGQAGKAQKAQLAHVLEGFDFSITTESGSKEDRARPLAAQVEAGKVYLSRAPWNAAFLAELAMFPAGKYKDQVDAASRVYARLIRARPRRAGATAAKLIDGNS